MINHLAFYHSFDIVSIVFVIIMQKINKINPLNHPYLQVASCIADLTSTWYYTGKLPDTRVPTVAIVGTRKPTSYGQEVTTTLATELSRRGVVIVSGLALGVDAIAHKAALDAGGVTIAVQANGLHRLYPPTNRQLGDQIIASGGAIISEYEPGVEPMSHRFLERNRIVSGIADVVIITEAASRSGTLNTAGHALTQGKDLFVVPGNITSPMSLGCNQLIKQGAMPVTHVRDILEVIAPQSMPLQPTLPRGDTPLETKVIELITSGVRNGDDIQKLAKVSASELSIALTMLEINGAIRPLGANQWGLS